jgi:Clp amino terminal domain, pathogenicity island component
MAKNKLSASAWGKAGQDMFDVLIAGYRQAMHTGDGVVDVTMILREALSTRLQAPMSVVEPLARAARDGLRGIGQREGWSGLRKSPGGVSGEVTAILRESAWHAARSSDQKDLPKWSGEVVDGLAYALEEAEAAGAEFANASHLLIGLLQTPAGSAVVKASECLSPEKTIAQLRSSRYWSRNGQAPVSAIDALEFVGGVASRVWWPLSLVPRMVGRVLRRRQLGQGPVIFCLEGEALRLAARLGDQVVTTAHLLLAIVSLDEQLAADGRQILGAAGRFSDTADVLHQCGVTDLFAYAPGNTGEETNVMPRDEAAERFFDGGKPGDPAWGYQAVTALDSAGTLAELSRTEPGTTHLLAALLANVQSSAYRLLEIAGADPMAVRDRAEHRLQRPDDM